MKVIQQQVHELMKQIEQLSVEVNNLTQQEQKVPYEKILLDAKKVPFTKHIVQKKDMHIKMTYFQMLLTIMNYVDSHIEERYQLLARLYYGLQLSEDFLWYVNRSNSTSYQDVHEFCQIIQQNQLVETFIVDMLMVLGIHQEQQGMEYVAELVSIFQMTEETFTSLCQLSQSFLEMNEDNVVAILLINIELLRKKSVEHYVQMMKISNVDISGDGKVEVNIEDILSFSNVKNIRLKDVCIVIPKGIVLKNLKKVEFDRCEIKGTDIKFSFQHV